MNKKYFNKLSIALVAVALFTASCEKAVDDLPTDLIETSKAFENVSDLDKGAVAAYSGFTYENQIWTAAFMSDEVRWGLDNNTRNFGLEHRWNFDPSSANTTAAWANTYTVIDRINRVLEASDAITAQNA